MNIPIPRIRDRSPVILRLQAVLVDGLLTVVDERNRSTVYRFAEIFTDFEGKAYQLAKMDGSECYHVNVSSQESETWCSCIGFERYGSCKHVAVCRQLVNVKPGDNANEPQVAETPDCIV